MNNWKKEVVNIAVTGRSGVGKSCFINAIRGDVNESHPDYAPVGHKECISKRRPYPHPKNSHLIFGDLPGVGTETFPRKTYLRNKEIQFQSYDVFIIMACERFTEDEKWLATEIQKLGKKYFFIRSKVDTDTNSNVILKAKAGKDSDPQIVISEIRNDCKKNLEDGFGDIYLINKLDLKQENLDFDRLIDRLITGFDGLKSEVLMFSLGFLTPKLLEQKIASLQNRIWGMGVV